MIEALAPIAPGAPLLAAMALLVRPSSSLAASRLALAGAVAAGVASLLLLVIAPEGGASALAGLLLVDRVRMAIALLAAAIATLVIAFASRALAGDGHESRFARLASLLTAATITLALAGNVIVLALAWVAVGQVLLALLAHDRTDPARDAVRRTRRAFLVGDAAVLNAVAIMTAVARPVRLDGALASTSAELAALPVAGIDGLRLIDVVAVLLVIAGIARSALVPLHRWLPGTLAAPTPVSALLHAGVVNGAGVLLLAMAPVFSAAAAATALAFGVGAATAVLGMAVMLVRVDVKGGLAWSTSAQMGFMVVQLAIGAYGAALFHLLGHGMYKAAAFLGAGDAISMHARMRHRPAPSSVPNVATRALAVVVTPTAGLGLAWWLIAPGFSPAKTLLFVTVAWLLSAYLVLGWLRSAPLGVAGSLATAAVGAPLVAGGYLTAIVGFERFVGAALPAAGAAAVGVVPLAVVLGAVLLAGVVLAALPASSTIRVRAYAWLVGSAIRPHRVRSLARRGAVAGAAAPVAVQPGTVPAAHALTPEVTR